MDYWLSEQMTEESFPLIWQHYITSFVYSEQGKNNPLINMGYRIRKVPIDIVFRFGISNLSIYEAAELEAANCDFKLLIVLRFQSGISK